MKLLFLLAFVTSAVSTSPAILSRQIKVPTPKVILFQKKTGKFIKNF